MIQQSFIRNIDLDDTLARPNRVSPRANNRSSGNRSAVDCDNKSETCEQISEIGRARLPPRQTLAGLTPAPPSQIVDSTNAPEAPRNRFSRILQHNPLLTSIPSDGSDQQFPQNSGNQCPPRNRQGLTPHDPVASLLVLVILYSCENGEHIVKRGIQHSFNLRLAGHNRVNS